MATLNEDTNLYELENGSVLGLHLSAGASDGYIVDAAEVLANVDGEAVSVQDALDTLEDKTSSKYVTTGGYDSTTKTIVLYSSDGTALSTIDATDFIKDGMLSSVEYSSGALADGDYLVDGYRISTVSDGAVSTTVAASVDYFKIGDALYQGSSSGATQITNSPDNTVYYSDAEDPVTTVYSVYEGDLEDTLCICGSVLSTKISGVFDSQEDLENALSSMTSSGGYYLYTQGVACVATVYNGSIISTTEAGSGVYAIYKVSSTEAYVYYSGTGSEWTLREYPCYGPPRSSLSDSVPSVYYGYDGAYVSDITSYAYHSCLGIYDSSSDLTSALSSGSGAYLHLYWNTDAGIDATTIDLSDLIDTDTTNSSLEFANSPTTSEYSLLTLTDSSGNNVSTEVYGKNVMFPSFYSDFITWPSYITSYQFATSLINVLMHFLLGGRWVFEEEIGGMHFNVDFADILESTSFSKILVPDQSTVYMTNIPLEEAFDYYVSWVTLDDSEDE